MSNLLYVEVKKCQQNIEMCVKEKIHPNLRGEKTVFEWEGQ